MRAAPAAELRSLGVTLGQPCAPTLRQLETLGDRQRFLDAGFDDSVTKPIVDEDVLIGAIERLLLPVAAAGDGVRR